MKTELFEIVTMGLKMILLIFTVLIWPIFKRLLKELQGWYNQKTTEAQRKDLLYWAEKGIKLAEDVYRDKGQGRLKKQYVINWLAKSGIKFAPEQADYLIDIIVEFFNKTDWQKEITNI